jgi:hypothetical protein
MLPWEKRKGIIATPNFGRETGLKAHAAWMNRKDRHAY